MGFDSLYFLALIPLIVIIHWLLPHKARPYFLLIVSYFIYGVANPYLLFLIFGTSLVSYLAALFIHKSEKTAVKRSWLIVTIIVSVGALFTFKYLNFIRSLIYGGISLFDPSISYNALDIILPVGISFYTFQTLAYVIDVYRGKLPAERNIFHYCLFVSFFPQLVAGPIEKAEDLLPQLKAERHFEGEDFSIGMRYLTMGYLKKLVIADFFGLFVAGVAADMGSASSLAIILSLFAFSIQIYGDFAGYSEIALGLGRLLGIKLTTNFDKPYLSTSFSEFWRRWHITLNRFFLEYVYIPLGGNRKGRFRKCLNTIFIFFLSGLWHGAELRYVIWGLCHGALMVIEDLLPKKERKRWGNILSGVLVFITVSFLWIFFYPDSLSSSISGIVSLFTHWNSLAGTEFFASPLNLSFSLLAIALLVFMNYLPKASFVYVDEEKKEAKALPSLGVVALYGLCFVLIGLSMSYIHSQGGGGSFIYFQF